MAENLSYFQYFHLINFQLARRMLWWPKMRPWPCAPGGWNSASVGPWKSRSATMWRYVLRCGVIAFSDCYIASPGQETSWTFSACWCPLRLKRQPWSMLNASWRTSSRRPKPPFMPLRVTWLTMISLMLGGSWHHGCGDTPNAQHCCLRVGHETIYLSGSVRLLRYWEPVFRPVCYYHSLSAQFTKPERPPRSIWQLRYCRCYYKEIRNRAKANLWASPGKLDELRHDIQQKTQALSVDELCLRTTSRSLETVADRNAYMAARTGTPSRNLPPSSHARRRTQGAQSARHEVSAHESARNEVLRQQEALRLNQSVA